MSGRKGRSGRKPNYYYVEIAELLKKSNFIINDFFNSPSVPISKKAQLAIELVKRQVIDKQHVKSDINVQQEQQINEYINRRYKDIN